MERRNLALLCAGVLCFWLFALAFGSAQGAGLRVQVAAGKADEAALVSAPAAQAQLEEPLRQFLQRWFGGDRAALPPPGVRLLSCDTATGGDLLPAVQAQRLRICLGNRALLCGQVTVAFAGKNLSDGRYLALFGPGLAGQARRYGRGKTRKQSCAGRAGGPPPKSSEPAQEGRISC